MELKTDASQRATWTELTGRHITQKVICDSSKQLKEFLISELMADPRKIKLMMESLWELSVIVSWCIDDIETLLEAQNDQTTAST